MAILRVRDADGNPIPIRAIRGERGEHGAGVHAGSYVGITPADANHSQYVDLGSPHVRAVLLETTDGTKPLIIVTADAPTEADGENAAALISGTLMGRGENVFLAVYTPATNLEGATYHYIAFVGEESA